MTHSRKSNTAVVVKCMLANMDKFFVFLLLLWVSFTAESKKLKRIEERLVRMETKHDIDSMTRREDISDLSQRLDDVEKWLNSSLADLSVSVRPSEIAGGGAHPEATVSEIDGSLMDDIERVKTAFAKEKARWRRQASDMEHTIQAVQNSLSSEMQSLVKAVKNELALEVSKMMTEINHEQFSEIQSLVKTAKNELTSGVGKMVNEVKDELSSEMQSSIKEVKDDVVEVLDTLDKLQSTIQVTVPNCSASLDRTEIMFLDKTSSVKPVEQTTSVNIIKPTFSSCLELYQSGERESDAYDIVLAANSEPIRVYCDMTTDGGGWTVFQRRQDGSEDFFRGWSDYASSFGNVNGEFWLGNDYISQMTGKCCHELRIDMEDFDGNTAYAKYGRFKVFPRGDDYKLDVGIYSGNASDSLEYHSGMSFTTKDKDNDRRSSSNCAQQYTGAWWYKSCYNSNLNGAYLDGGTSAKGINWYYWSREVLKRTEMKFRKL